MKTALIDVDDLWTEDQIIQYLVPLKKAVPNLIVTAYGIPNKLGPVHNLLLKYPWLFIAQHGYEHTPFECRAWTEDLVCTRLQQAREMGYLSWFKPPNWTCDMVVEQACLNEGVVLHHHEDYEPSVEGLLAYPGIRGTEPHEFIHTHITPNPVTSRTSARILRPSSPKP